MKTKKQTALKAVYLQGLAELFQAIQTRLIIKKVNGLIVQVFVSKRKCEITFRTKATGEPSLAFIASSVLAYDGEGSEILTSQGTGKASFTIAPAKPVVENRDS